MFSSINFLFLISLAVTTWIILCYFKQIEQQREDQMTIELHMNEAFEDTVKANACFENYDIYLNFLAIFACIYALARVASVAENYVAQQVHARFKLAKLPSSASAIEPSSMEELSMQHLQLTMQVEYLEKENAKLEQKIKQLEQTNFILGGNRFRPLSTVRLLPSNSQGNAQPDSCNNKTPSDGLLHTCSCSGGGSEAEGSIGVEGVACNQTATVCGGGNAMNEGVVRALTCGLIGFRDVYIRDHFQQVYVNEGNIELQFQDFNQEGGNITQIWQKYLEMQKYAIQKPTTPHKATEMANAVPIVVSTEELQTLQGCVLTNSNNME
ncbi:uncharacterized protein LOC101454031 isoform X2 [Ceratitis capitata]|uniref:(Mediterranean fruit fly) hypothetical protein n=1 Tax=Ceratitis capitata TaxID=7213 RepID=W8CD85_CERCA|nr:uncharacterized protein LOC101454031 isoform X2 [Ceratitis capitata]CAD7005208.1 unnamed protein product [Ceratitis capitata]